MKLKIFKLILDYSDMRKATLVLKIVLLVSFFQLSGCASVSESIQNQKHAEKNERFLQVQETLKTQNSIKLTKSQIKSAWGFFYDLPNFKYIEKKGYYTVEFEWTVPDEIMKASFSWYDRDKNGLIFSGSCHIWYDKVAEKLKSTGEVAYESCPIYDLTIDKLSNGEFKDHGAPAFFDWGGYTFKAFESGYTTTNKRGETETWYAYSPEKFEAHWLGVRNARSAARSQEINETLERQAAVYQGLKTFESSYNQAQYDQQQSDYNQQQFLNDLDKTVTKTEKAKVSQSKKASTANTSTQSSGNSNNSDTQTKNRIVSKKIEAKPSPLNNTNIKQKSKLLTFPEAIVACTRPQGPSGNFRCETPINSLTGHNKDLTERRTPELMVESISSTCPNPFRLQSSTHLVWGCGFAATGANNALDKSGGVDVHGRRTFYCYPKQTSCRNESNQ